MMTASCFAAGDIGLLNVDNGTLIVVMDYKKDCLKRAVEEEDFVEAKNLINEIISIIESVNEKGEKENGNAE